MKNKQKYKSRKQDLNTPVNVVPKPIVDLDSNWDRYEDEDDIAIPSGTDFALLASAPIKPSGRFQLKSDKTTMEQIENANTTDNFFDLDLDLLSSSLSAIPFHERLGIDEDYFPVSTYSINRQYSFLIFTKFPEWKTSTNEERCKCQFIRIQ